MIEIDHFEKRYGDRVAVSNLTLSVGPGEIFGLVGPNGAGKSTTVKTLAGLLRPTSGRVTVNGIDVARDPLEVKRRVGYVPEDGALFEVLTVTEYLRLVSELRGLERGRSEARIARWMDRFSLLGRSRTRIHDLSRGQRQKVLIVQALLAEPRVLLLDEPLSGLDPLASRTLRDLLLDLAAEGVTMVYSSHNLDVVERLCHRIGVLHRGRLRAIGSPAEIVDATRSDGLESAFLQLTGDDTEQPSPSRAPHA